MIAQYSSTPIVKHLAPIVALTVSVALWLIPQPSLGTEDYSFDVRQRSLVEDRNFETLHLFAEYYGGSGWSWMWQCSTDNFDSGEYCLQDKHFKRVGPREKGHKGISLGKAGQRIVLHGDTRYIQSSTTGKLTFQYRIRGRNPSKKAASVKGQFVGPTSTEPHTLWAIYPKKKSGWRKASINFNNKPTNLNQLAFSIDAPKRNRLKLQLRNLNFISETVSGYVNITNYSGSTGDNSLNLKIVEPSTGKLLHDIDSEFYWFVSLNSLDVSPGEKEFILTYQGNEYRTTVDLKRSRQNQINLRIGTPWWEGYYDY